MSDLTQHLEGSKRIKCSGFVQEMNDSQHLCCGVKLPERKVRSTCLCLNFNLYLRLVWEIILFLAGIFACVLIIKVIIGGSKKLYILLVVIIGIFFLITWYYMRFHHYYCTMRFIPQHVHGCRRKMRKHDLPLEETLKRLANYIPGTEKLADIEELARTNLEQLSWELKSTFQVPFEICLTGSTAERFNSPLSSIWMKCSDVDYSHALVSDYDYMMSPENIFASYQPGESFLVKDDTLDINPGYVKLTYGSSKYSSIMNFYTTRDVKDKLKSTISNIPFREFNGYISDDPNQNYASVVSKGPTLKLKVGRTKYEIDRFLADLTFSIPCNDWPILSNWQTRNKKWPQQEDVERIILGGIHLVPLSQKEDKQGLTWRISFSKAEVEISKLIPEVARTCFVALKVIAKDYLSVNCRCLKSYHLKTLLLHSIETTGLEFWCEEHLKECFSQLLINLTTAIEEKRCSHFWLPDINFFEDLREKDQKKSLKVLRKVKEKPEKFIELLTEEEEKTQTDNIKLAQLTGAFEPIMNLIPYCSV